MHGAAGPAAKPDLTSGSFQHKRPATIGAKNFRNIHLKILFGEIFVLIKKDSANTKIPLMAFFCLG
jgi:hypothetical protein